MLNPLRNRDGVALPLALLGMVIVSFLVTAALVSSSTEVAISGAHQDATSSLYGVEGALEEYVALRAASVTAANPTGLAPTSAPDLLVPGHAVTVGRLYSDLDTITPGDTLYQRQTFSLVAGPATGVGRQVAAMVATERKAKMFKVSVSSGLTVGGDIEVTGSSTISDGRNAACDSAAAPNALQVTEGSKITKAGQSTIEGRADTATFSKAEMVQRLLGGLTLREAASYASIKFAPGEFSGRVKSYDTAVRLKTNKYNWGCPVGDPCTTVSGNGANTSYYPMVALDAGGGKIVLEGDHGQGVLIIYNGSAEIKGNLVYKGIILVEKDLIVQGTGGGGVKVEGAIVALGENSTVQDNTSGNAVITFNKCIITTAQQEANLLAVLSAPQRFPRKTFSWFEVVR